MKNGKPTMVELNIIALVGILFVILLLQYNDGGVHTVSAEGPSGEEHIITSSVRWNDTTVFASSIHIKAGGILRIENMSIIMNNTGAVPSFVNEGTLIMNSSELIPMKIGSSVYFEFSSYGPCELNENEIFEPKNLVFFNTSVIMRENTIFDSQLDSIHIVGEGPQGGATPTFIGNTIIDSGRTGFRFEDVIATVSDTRILGTKTDGIFVERSKVTLTNCTLEDIQGIKVSIGEDSVVQIQQGTNITSDDIRFRDQTSVVRIQTGDVFVTVTPPDPDSSSDLFADERLIGMLVVFLVVAAIGITLFLDRRNDRHGQHTTDQIAQTDDTIDTSQENVEEIMEEDGAEDGEKVGRVDDEKDGEVNGDADGEVNGDADGEVNGEADREVNDGAVDREKDGVKSEEGWTKAEEGKVGENKESEIPTGEELPPPPPHEEPHPGTPVLYDFEGALRKLESLRRDNLVTVEEYQEKRKRILDRI